MVQDLDSENDTIMKFMVYPNCTIRKNSELLLEKFTRYVSRMYGALEYLQYLT